MMMPGRKYSIVNTNYRYGFNGKENDNEVKGEGNQQDYGFRIYDTRLGRFLSVDPITKEYPWNSTYAFAENDLIRSIDLEGLERLDMASGDPGLNSANATKQERQFYTRQTSKPVKDFIKIFSGYDYGYSQGEAMLDAYAQDGMVGVQSELLKETKLDIANHYVSSIPRRTARTKLQVETAETTTTTAPAKKQVTATGEKVVKTSSANEIDNKPTEAYNRQKHYGKTPTAADRAALETKPNEVVDHTIPLVQHYYEGDGTAGSKPGFQMTQEERREFAKDRSRMRNQPIKESNQQGAKMSQYSKKQKKTNGL